MIPSRRISRLGEGVFERNDQRKQKYCLEQSFNNSLPLIDLSLGSSDLLPPERVLRTIKDSIDSPDSSSYSLHASTRKFREEVSCWAKKRFGVDVDPDREVLLLIGSQEGTANLPRAVMNTGESGLILDPSYPSHQGGLILADASIEKLRLHYHETWRPNFSSLTNSQWDQLRLFTFGFPHNPTAQVGKQEYLDEAMKIGIRHQVVIAHDNPYLDLTFTNQSPALLNCVGWRECGIEFFSFSKAWCMGGFRLGFAIGASTLIDSLKKMKSVIDFNQTLAIQRAGIVALSEEVDWPKKIRKIYLERRNVALKKLKTLGWNVPTPMMSMYLWMPLPEWSQQRGWDDERFVSELLFNTGVSLTPGSGFGLGGANWIRLALVRPKDELEEAISRIHFWWNEKI